MELLFQPGFWCTVAIVVIGVILWRVLSSAGITSKKSLPGPWGLPIVGYIPFLGRRMNKTITALSKRYGDVFQISIGTRKIVVVNGQKAIREALLTKGVDFAGRPDFYSFRVNSNFAFRDYSPTFRAHKKLSQKAFQMFYRERQAELQQVTGSYT